MRTERVVVHKAWFPFGRDMPGMEEVAERRLILSERERATLRSAAVILGKAREAVDPHDWDDIREGDMRVLAMGECYVGEAADAGFFIVDDEPKT